MAYEVLARKWRPQQFSQVIGQDHVTQTLKNAIASKRIAHAYLFVGPRGTGKTSLARILAKSLNCVEGPTATPCDKCDSCKEIIGSSSLDVLEIDGASNTGVDQVRELRETVKYRPAVGRYKIYIIDEVHMLSSAAFNALLKTIEEPPPHVRFIFATTEPQKVLPTILSRCQRFDLRRIPVSLIVKTLSGIARAEGIKVDAEALGAIARGCEGSLRDAESVLDQLVSFRGNEVREEDVLSVFGLVAGRTIEELAESILRSDIKRITELVAEMDKAGKDVQRVIFEMFVYFKNLLVCATTNGNVEGMDVMESQVETLKRHAGLTDAERLLRVTDVLAETEDRLRYALSKRTLLEVGLIRCAKAVQAVSLEAVLSRIEEARKALSGNCAGAGGAEPGSAYAGAARAASAAPMVKETARGVEDEKTLLARQWHDIIERVSKISLLARGWLSGGRPVAVDGNRVIIAFDPEFAEEIEEAVVSRNRRAVEHVLSEILRRPVVAEFKLGEAEKPATAGKDRKRDHPNSGPGMQKLANDPAVQRVMGSFGARILDIKE